jgi:hypothetical protein
MELLGDKNKGVSATAALSLARVLPHAAAVDPILAKYVPRLVKLVDSPSQEVKGAAAPLLSLEHQQRLKDLQARELTPTPPIGGCGAWFSAAAGSFGRVGGAGAGGDRAASAGIQPLRQSNTWSRWGGFPPPSSPAHSSCRRWWG